MTSSKQQFFAWLLILLEESQVHDQFERLVTGGEGILFEGQRTFVEEQFVKESFIVTQAKEFLQQMNVFSIIEVRIQSKIIFDYKEAKKSFKQTEKLTQSA